MYLTSVLSEITFQVIVKYIEAGFLNWLHGIAMCLSVWSLLLFTLWDWARVMFDEFSTLVSFQFYHLPLMRLHYLAGVLSDESLSFVFWFIMSHLFMFLYLFLCALDLHTRLSFRPKFGTLIMNKVSLDPLFENKLSVARRFPFVNTTYNVLITFLICVLIVSVMLEEGNVHHCERSSPSFLSHLFSHPATGWPKTCDFWGRSGFSVGTTWKTWPGCLHAWGDVWMGRVAQFRYMKK